MSLSGSRILQPTVNDPTARLFARIADLDARLGVLEAQRPAIFTPFQNSDVDLPPVTYAWHGGRVFYIGGARASGASAGSVNFRVNGTTIQSRNVVAGSDIATGLVARDVTQWMTATTTLDKTNGGGTTSSVADCLLIEWGAP